LVGEAEKNVSAGQVARQEPGAKALATLRHLWGEGATLRLAARRW
jgi:hypothetical protein